TMLELVRRFRPRILNSLRLPFRQGAAGERARHRSLLIRPRRVTDGLLPCSPPPKEGPKFDRISERGARGAPRIADGERAFVAGPAARRRAGVRAGDARGGAR